MSSSKFASPFQICFVVVVAFAAIYFIGPDNMVETLKSMGSDVGRWISQLLR
jgi:hypothetical protein